MNQRIAITSAATLVTLLFGASAANAAPLSLNAGDYELKFGGHQQLSSDGAISYENEDGETVETGESAWGVVRGTTLGGPEGDEWTSGDQGGMFGIFHGFEPLYSDDDNFLSNGGQLDLYYHEDAAGDFKDFFGDGWGPDLRDSDASFGDVQEGEQLISIEFEPGALEDDFESDEGDIFEAENITLEGDRGPFGGGFSGDANAYGDVIDDSGVWADQIQRGTYTPGEFTRDIEFTSSYNDDERFNVENDDVEGATIDDPARWSAEEAEVPTPGTLLLMGLGLLGLGGIFGAARGNHRAA